MALENSWGLCVKFYSLQFRDIGSPIQASHFRGVWASPTPRREAQMGRTAPRLPWNDWGKVLLACTCVTSHATYKKKKAGTDWILTRSISLIFAILTRSLKRPGSIWAATGWLANRRFSFHSNHHVTCENTISVQLSPCASIYLIIFAEKFSGVPIAMFPQVMADWMSYLRSSPNFSKGRSRIPIDLSIPPPPKKKWKKWLRNWLFFFFFFTQVQTSTPVTLCSGELWSLISYCWYNPQPMRNDHSIAGTTILQTTLTGISPPLWIVEYSGGETSTLCRPEVSASPCV